ncbi:hypothetical protein R1sor_023470 [Riccia sorocarpa]|uniref:Uncharacterized protein n=1 Tax=Riccia sorocarpa TaxID=122646 RepID=A0ABD3GRW2_9MARC
MTRKCKLDEMIGEAVNRKDILLFLRNICQAHRSGAFGGKDALWSFLCDVGRNTNRTRQGHRYSKTTQAITQALFQFGGRQDQNFLEIAKILEAAKREYGIEQDVPVILAEDETRVKPRIRWEAKRDTLIGFCGNKENHVCEFGLELEVGCGEVRYSKIVNSFEQNVQGSYVVKGKWDEHCRDIVGPVIGHASDGDSRRRKLMLEDYNSCDGQRWSIGWEGWSFSGSVLSSGDVYGLGDQDPPHNGKKLINPLDRSTLPLVLGDFHACLEHVQLVYKLYPVDAHGLNIDDVIRRDRQNWAGPQRLCSRKVQHCLRLLSERADSHQERTTGTRIYLEIVSDYLDIFYSVSLSLRQRVVLCAKISCHMVVLLVRLFRDKFPGLSVPLHLLGSDCCEHFFSRVGGMSGVERNYDFGDLLDCASGLNRLTTLEYGEENLRFSKVQVKQQTIWSKLHPLGPGQIASNLADFDGLQSDIAIIEALKVGFSEAQDMLIQLNMAPHSRVRDQQWWNAPWVIECEYKTEGTVLCLDDVERNASSEGEFEDSSFCDLWDTPSLPSGGDDDIGDDIDDLSVVGHETRQVMTEMFNDALSEKSLTKVDPMVSLEGHMIYKATLVSQLVGNPTLSKDRLTRIKQSVYFNGVKPKPRVEGVPVCIMDIGSDCAVLFDTTRTNVLTRSKKRKRSSPTSKEVWFGRIQKIKRKYNGKWGKTRAEIDLLDRPIPQAGEGSICQVLFNWYTPVSGSKVKYLYEGTDLQWIDLESVLSVVTMKMEKNIRTIWNLDQNDRIHIDEFMAQYA